MDTLTVFLDNIAAVPAAASPWDANTDLPGVAIHHLGQAFHDEQTDSATWLRTPVSRMWTTYHRTPVASCNLIRGEDDPATLAAAARDLIDRTRVSLTSRRSAVDAARAGALAALTDAAVEFARHARSDSGLDALIRHAHLRLGVPAETVAAVITQSLDSHRAPAVYAGHAEPDWSAAMASRWLDRALAGAGENSDGELCSRNGDEMAAADLIRAARNRERQAVTTAVTAAAEAADTARVTRDRAILDALDHGMTQKAVAGLAGLTQGRVAQIVAQYPHATSDKPASGS